MSNLIYPIISVTIVSLVSLIGLFGLSLKEATLDRILFILLSLAAGSILGTAYLDLFPEAIEFLSEENISSAVMYVTVGFLAFFFLERFIYWFHGHIHGFESLSEVDERVTVKLFVYLNLIGDGIHNFIDGMIITASFVINSTLGLSTTIAVLFHELPQEIGDFGVLVYGGLPRYKALIFNFLTALTAILGVLVSNYLSTISEGFVGLLMAFAAGGFIYIAASELIPEIQKEKNIQRSAVQFIIFVIGIVLIWSLGILFH